MRATRSPTCTPCRRLSVSTIGPTEVHLAMASPNAVAAPQIRTIDDEATRRRAPDQSFQQLPVQA